MRVLISDLAPGIGYALQFRSRQDVAVSEWSRLFYVVTASDTVAPKAPTGLTGAMNGTSFLYSWTAVTQSADNSPAYDLDHYLVKIESTGSGATAFFIVNDIKFELSFEKNVTAFAGTPQAEVGCSVCAVDTAGNASAYTSVVAQTNAAPTQPTGFAVQALQDTINLTWNAVTDLDLKEYRVYAGTTSGFTPGSGNLVYSGMVTSFINFTIAYGVDTYYKLASIDVFGTPSTYAASGAVRPVSPFGADTTAPSVPIGLAATLSTDIGTLITSAALLWTAVADPTNDLASYIIGYRVVGATDWTYETVDYTLTSAKIDRLTPYVNYDFRIRASDWAANLSAWSSTVTSTTAAVDAAPSQPVAPTASSGTLQVQVTQTFVKQAGGALEFDVISFNVYASITTGFTPADANKLGQIIVGPTNVGTFFLPATGGTTTQTWYIKTIAVDRGGNISAASNQATATPGLIAATNIIDATITNAKIADLAADKITAGTGFINALFVNSVFTLGDATHTGVIKSYGYVAGTTGFSMDKTLLEINQGSIAAAALKIQQGKNLIPIQYAGFEFAPNFYLTGFPAGGFAKTIATTGAKYETQCVQFRAPTAAANEIYLGASVTDYNINVEAGKTYIVSAWVKGGPVTSNFSFHAKYSDATSSALFGTTSITAAAAYARQSATLLIPAGVTAMVLRLDCTTATINAGWDVDGIQVEEQWGATSTPSVWTPPSSTSIDGGYIRTGEIRSTTTVTVNSVAQPSWLITMAGGAQFGNVLVRGNLLIGASGTDLDAGQSYVASGNFVADSTGWKIDSSGRAEFNNGIYRGTLGARIVDAQSIQANAIDGMIITGSLIQSSASLTTGMKIDGTGLRAYDSTGLNTIAINADGTASITGLIVAHALSVDDHMAVHGVNNEFSTGSDVTLATGVTAPAVSPTVVMDNPYAEWSDTPNNISGGFYSTYHYVLRQSTSTNACMITTYDSAGVWQADISLTGTPAYLLGGRWGPAQIGTDFYILAEDGSGSLYVVKYNSAGAYQSIWIVTSTFTSYRAIGVNAAGTNLLIAQRYGTTLAITEYTPTGTVVTGLTVGAGSLNADIASVMVGSFDYGATRYVVAPVVGSVHTFTLSGTTLTDVTNETFPSPSTGYCKGIYWDGTYLWSLMDIHGDGSVIRLYQFSTIKWTTESAKWWASYAWYNTTSAYETLQGPRTSFTMRRRARLTMTSPSLPESTTPAIDAEKTFLGRGATDPGRTGMFHSGATPTPDVRAYSEIAEPFTGSNPLATGTFPAGVAATLTSGAMRADGVTPKWTLSGDGTVSIQDVTIAGSTVVVTSAGGDATISFGVTFTAAPIFVCVNGDTSAHGNMTTAPSSSTSTTTTGSLVRCIIANTAASVASVSVRINWTATGVLA